MGISRYQKAFGIIISVTVLFASTFFVSSIILRANALQTHSAILIVGNGGFTAANGVTGGTGTALDPYMISGWNISALTVSAQHPGSYVHLEIDNTTAHFVIQNVSVEGSVNANGQAAIISGVANGRIESSSIAGYCQIGVDCWAGLTVQSSNNVTLSHDTINQLSLSRDTSLSLVNSRLGPFGYYPTSPALQVNNCHNCLISANYIDATGGFGIQYSYDTTISDNSAVGDVPGGGPSVTSTPIYVVGGSGIRVIGNIVTGGIGDNIDVDATTNATISGNTVRMTQYDFYDSGDGIGIWSSSAVVVSGNNVIDSICPGNGYDIIVGVSSGSPTDVQVFGNNITHAFSCRTPGITLQSASKVLVYHNNLFNVTLPATDDRPSANAWDNGYPSGGNYWSNYKGVDNCRGPQQNVCPSPDGIGDTPYTFNSGQDNYPLMTPFAPNPPASASGGGGGGGGRPPLQM